MPEIIYQTTFRQQIVFPEVPPRLIRQALIAAGFRYTGAFWHYTNGNAYTIGESHFAHILEPHIEHNRQIALAPAGKLL